MSSRRSRRRRGAVAALRQGPDAVDGSNAREIACITTSAQNSWEKPSRAACIIWRATRGRRQEGYVFDEYDSENEDFSLAQATAWASGPGDMQVQRFHGRVESEGAYAGHSGLGRAGIPHPRRGGHGRLHYDRRLDGDKIIDLVVAFTDVVDARDLLASFDLEICKSEFDGRVFRIPDPHRAFRGETRSTRGGSS